MELEMQSHKRPFGLFIIIILQLVIAVLLSLALLGVPNIAKYLKILVQDPIFYSWFGWVLVGFIVLAILGMFFLKRWGWILTMILTGLGLAFSIWSYFQGEPHYFSMVIHLVIVFYLNQHNVQSAFPPSEFEGGAL